MGAFEQSLWALIPPLATTMPAFPSHIFTKQAPNNAGNGLFSSQAIDACTEIFRVDRPLVSVLDSRHLKNACSYCYIWLPQDGIGQMGGEQGRTVKLRACQGCKIIRYCSKVACYCALSVLFWICPFLLASNLVPTRVFTV